MVQTPRLRLDAVIAGAMLAIAGPACPALAHGDIPASVPIDRIIENVTQRLAAHPDDAHAHYVLGRAHGLAYETKNQNIFAWREQSWRGLEPAAAGWQARRWSRDAADVPTEEELIVHLREAITNLNRAIELDPTRGAYWLALASILEAGQNRAAGCAVHPLPPTVEGAGDFEPYLTSFFEGDEPGGYWGTADYFINRTSSWDEEASPRDHLVAGLLKEIGAEGAHAAKARELLLLDWANQVTECYFRAMCASLPGESQEDSKPLWGSLEDYVAYEAARHYVRIVKERGPRADERIRVATAEGTVKGFENLPDPGGITPVVFSLEQGRTLADLTDRTASVAFDLDGLGRGARWSWVRPETAILVWDPERTGEITSGRQLFGSVSWWLMFEDGYQALDALDDDRDTSLTGAELNGIAVWFDRNQSGVSEAGEVVPIEDLGVVRLACRADGMDSGCPAASTGVEFADGTVLNTVDWVALPVSLRQVSSAEPAPTSAEESESNQRYLGFWLSDLPF